MNEEETARSKMDILYSNVLGDVAKAIAKAEELTEFTERVVTWASNEFARQTQESCAIIAKQAIEITRYMTLPITFVQRESNAQCEITHAFDMASHAVLKQIQEQFAVVEAAAARVEATILASEKQSTETAKLLKLGRRKVCIGTGIAMVMIYLGSLTATALPLMAWESTVSQLEKGTGITGSAGVLDKANKSGSSNAIPKIIEGKSGASP